MEYKVKWKDEEFKYNLEIPCRTTIQEAILDNKEGNTTAFISPQSGEEIHWIPFKDGGCMFTWPEDRY